MATQARVLLKIPARIVGAGNISVTLENGIYVISDAGGKLLVTTVASLPSAIGKTGTQRLVTDALSTSFSSVVSGGGTNVVPVYSDGTNWRIG